METDADRQLDEAREHVRQACLNLVRVTLEGCPGAADYGDDARGRLQLALGDLMRVKTSLGD